jgi:hypothetical protein
MAAFGTNRDTTPVELTERFERVFRWIEDHGGEYQRTLPHFAEDVGLNEKALQRIIARMERYGCVLIIRSGHPTLGMGRFPNLYRLRMTWDEWMERRPGILEKNRQRNAAISRKNALKAAVSAANRRRGTCWSAGDDRRPQGTDDPPARQVDQPPVEQGSTPPPPRLPGPQLPRSRVPQSSVTARTKPSTSTPGPTPMTSDYLPAAAFARFFLSAAASFLRWARSCFS